VMSAATDGTFVALDNPLWMEDAATQHVVPQAAAAVAAAAEPAAVRPEVEDIQSSDVPTLEEASLAAEQQAAAAHAAGVRAALAGEVAALRKELEALVTRNGREPPGSRLPPAALEVDPGGCLSWWTASSSGCARMSRASTRTASCLGSLFN